MSRIGNTIDERIQDLIDGRMTADERSQLLGEVAGDTAKLHELIEMVDDDTRLRGMMNGALDEPVPDRLLAVIDEARDDDELQPVMPSGPVDSGRRPAALGLSAVLGMALGAALGWLVGVSDTPIDDPFELALGEAVSAFSFYLEDPDYPVDFNSERIADFLPRTEVALGRQVEPPDLSASGFTLVGGRIIPAPSGRAIMYLYERTVESGRERIAVYCWRASEGTAPQHPPAPAETDVATSSWQSNGLNFTMLAQNGQPDFDQLQGNIRSHFDAMGMSTDSVQ